MSRRSPRPARRLASLLLAALLVTPHLAAGAPSTCRTATALTHNGLQLYEDEEYGSAYALFKTAHKFCPRESILLYYIGRTSDKLGMVEEAIRFYESFLAAEPDALAEQAGQVGERLFKLKFNPRGNLSIACDPERAAVFLDDRKVGSCPLVLEGLRSGEYELEVRAPGFEAFAEVVKVEPERVVREQVTLEAGPPAGTPDLTSQPPAPLPEALRHQRLLQLSLTLGVGVLAASGALGAYLLYADRLADQDEAEREGGLEQARSAQEQAGRLQALAVALGVTSAAALGWSTYLWATLPPPASATVTPRHALLGVGLVW